MENFTKHIIEGVNDHGFDINSPEIIQDAINKGDIKPFERVQEDTDIDKPE